MAQDITTGLIAHWELDETSGNTAADSSINNYTATSATSAAWTTGQVGGCHDFNASNELVVNSLLGNPTTFTVAAWVNLEIADAAGATVINIGNSIELRIDDVFVGGLPVAAFFAGSDQDVQYPFVTSPTALTGTGWHHIAAVLDTTADVLLLYVDGVQVGSTSTTSQVAWGMGINTTIGGEQAASGYTFYDFDGQIDDLRVYSRALTATDIAALNALGGGSGGAAGLEGRWKFNETSGTTAADSSGNSHHGTLVGSATWDSSGRMCGAVTLNDDGVDLIDLPSAVVNGATDLTFTCWFRTSKATDLQTIISGANAGHFNEFGLFLQTNATEIRYLTGEIGSWLDWTLPFSPADGQWHHLALVRDDANNQVSLYLDGALVGTQSTTLNALQIDSGGLVLGEDQDALGGGYDASQALDGSLDDVRIYRKVLNAEEVQAIYTGLVGHWTFDEGTGTTIADSSINANDASFNTGSPAWIDGMRGKALEFDGTNDAVTGSNFDPPECGAVAFWFRSDGPVLSRQRQWGVGADFETWQDTDGLMSMDVSTDGYQGGFITTSPIDSAGDWYHIIAQYNSSNDAYEIYINGQLHKSGTSTWNIQDQAANLLSFGTRTGSTERFSGALDDFRIYERWLSNQEITELYGLVGHWKLDETSGTTFVDQTLTGNDATFNTGTPLWTEGQRGNALEFDGASEAQTGSNFTPPDRGAVAFWMRSSGPSIQRELLFGVGDDFEVRQKFTGTLVFDLLTSAGNLFEINEVFSDPERWIHVIAQYDASDDSYEVYLDGQLSTSGVSIHDLQTVAAGKLTFGNSTGDNKYFSGTLDDIRIYNRWLKPKEIADIYGLIGWWRMEETSGSAVSDSSGADNHGTVVGTGQWSTDSKEASGSIALDGTNYVQVPGIPIKSDDDGVTLAGWAKLASVDTEGAELISVGDYAILRLDMVYSGVGTGAFIFHGAGWDEATTGRDLAGTGWHHLVMTYNASANSLKFYLNGVLQTTTSPVGNLFLDFLGNEVAIGRHGNGQATYDFNGRLDDVRLYNRAINRREARALYYGKYVRGIRIIKWVETR